MDRNGRFAAWLTPAIIWPMNADWFAALAGAIQALGVVPALAVGAMALRGDRNDRQVDRVLELHQELVGSELDVDRRQVARRARETGDPIAQLIYRRKP